MNDLWAEAGNAPYAIITLMGIRTGLIIFILLGLVGAFFAFRAGIHSMQISRRQASWPERQRQRVAGSRFFGMAILVVLLDIACVSFIITGGVIHPVILSSPVASPGI